MFFVFGVTNYILLALGTLIVLGLLVYLFFTIRRLILQRYSLLRYFYPFVRKTAVYYDYYLINRLKIILGNNESLHIDHIIFADKYIYVISDFIFKGSLTGNPVDPKWILKDKKDNEVVIDSPLLESKKILQKLSLRTSLDHSTFIGITLVGKETKITDLDVNDGQHYVIDTRDFSRLIRKIESRDIHPLNQDELKKRVHEIASLNSYHSRKGK